MLVTSGTPLCYGDLGRYPRVAGAAFKFPSPIALVACGALLRHVPNLPQFPFDPQQILVIVLPPILNQAALLTS